MRKRFGIVIVALILVAFAKSEKDTYSANTQQNQKLAAFVLPVKAQGSGNPEVQKIVGEKESSELGRRKTTPEPNSGNPTAVKIIELPQRDVWDKAATGINSALAVIGIIGVFIGLRTLKKIERQINTAESANRAMVAAQRAWVILRPEIIEGYRVSFFALNGGQTPARILSIHGKIHKVERGKELTIDWDSLNDSMLGTPPEFLPPGTRCIAYNIDLLPLSGITNLDEFKESMKRNPLELIFYGKIRYLCVLEAEKIVHETRWRYWYVAMEGFVPTQDPMHLNDNSWG